MLYRCTTRGEKGMWIGKVFLPLLLIASGMTPMSAAYAGNGETLFMGRCAMCHGSDVKGSGPLARKSDPPTPDLTTPAFKRRLAEYPGVIVSSIILRPNGDLIPRTLKENGYRLPPHAWTVKDFRDINDYLRDVINKSK